MGRLVLASVIVVGFMLYCAPFVLLAAFVCMLLAGCGRDSKIFGIIDKVRRWPNG
jgi:hypothetical protein